MVKGVLIDLDGVVYVGNQALPGSLDAIHRIRELRIPCKFITNTTRRPRRQIVSDLAWLGLDIIGQDLSRRQPWHVTSLHTGISCHFASCIRICARISPD